MRQQIITGLKKKLLMVELPEDAIQVGYSMFDNKGNCYLEYYTRDKKCIKTNIMVNIDSENYKLTDIKEEQLMDIVDEFNYKGAFRDYTEKLTWGYFDPADDLASFFLTRKESLFSALEANKIVFENSLGKKPARMVPFMHAGQYTESQLEKVSEYQKQLKEWQQAQEEVWDINRCWLFGIL